MKLGYTLVSKGLQVIVSAYSRGVNEPLQARALLEHARKIGRSKMARLEIARLELARAMKIFAR